MGYEFSKGDFFVTVGDKTITLGEGIPFTAEIELSAKENPSHLYHFNSTPSIDFEVSGTDLLLMNSFCSMPSSNGKFTMEYSIPIMIQARWHKKPRINKKWLKRFGMKSDTIKCRANATAGEYHTDDGSFDFESDMPEFLWRPDQLRKDLKIEF